MRVLFVPVSAARGLGEYARCREIALAVQAQWPAARLHFILSRQAPYAADCPFPATLLPGSATLHTPEVLQVIETFRPQVVIFDNAGRTAQIRAARRAGAFVIYASSRARQRRKAFRLRWMRLLDEHWIVYPRLIAGAPTLLERLKLRLLGRPAVRYMDTVLPAAQVRPDAAPLARFALVPEGYVLIVPGGGSSHPGAAQAPGIVAAAALRLAASGVRTLLVGVAVPQNAPPLLCATALVPLTELLCLMRGARLVVSNGGDTLLQALACRRPCIAVAIAPDQAGRIARLRAAGLIGAAPLRAAALERAVLTLLADHEARAQLMAAAARHPIVDAMPVIARIIGAHAAALGPEA